MAKTKYSYNEKRGAWIVSVWDGTYDEKGRKHRRQISSKKSSRDLENKVNEFKARVGEQSFVDCGNMSFYDYALEWVSTAKVTKEKNTQRMYESAVRSYFSHLNTIRIGDIKHSHYQRIINQNASHPRTCQIIAITFRQIVKAAARDHLLSRMDVEDLLENISMPRYVRKERRTLTPLEKDAIMKADLDDRNAAFIFILYYCGLRKEEALALTPDCFDFEKKTVRIQNVVIFYNGKAEMKPYPKSHNGIRLVPLPDALIARVRDYVENCDGLLFKCRSGAPMTHSGYERMWDGILTKLNMAVGYNPFARKDRPPRPITDLTAHIFRHNYCTELCYQVPKGLLTTKKIAKIFGDTEEMVLKIYSHILEDKEDASGAVNAAFSD